MSGGQPQKSTDQSASKASSNKPFLKLLKQGPKDPLPATPPIWMMRQAGRYLPEYREVRKQAGGFLNLCYNPKNACEVTLQPIRRYGFDAAILFSDILVVPDALGQPVRFETGEGPRLDPITDAAGLAKLDPLKTSKTYSSIYETVDRIKSELPDETTLIGFCGAPFTVATYMIAGRGTPDQAPARTLAYRDPDLFQNMIDMLVDSSIEYLRGQIDAGAQVVQVFDSWASVLPDEEFQKWCLEPMVRICEALGQSHPLTPIIGFPRAVGPLYKPYLEKTGVNAIGCDTSLSLSYIRDELQPHAVVQGNLDPMLLLNGGPQFENRVRKIIETLAGGRHIFNLGHGIIKETPLKNVERLVELVRGSAK
ncbi:MAG: uroporphyrinogen decarboxylase [Hyphomicrobiaceae bacterium]|nr:uroporphyrinogen decarboxylase [Hyphomicrobiaceae bacterium]